MKKILTLLLLTALTSTLAKNKIIDFNQKKGLKADEGIVVLIIDINFRISKISLGKSGKIFPVYSMKKLRPGTQMKIIKLKEGKYHWKEGTGRTGTTTYSFEIDEEPTSFVVEAGKTNYPGYLEFRGWLNNNNDVTYSYNMINNSLKVFEFMKANYSSLIEKYPLVYSGDTPDPFLEYNEQLDQDSDH